MCIAAVTIVRQSTPAGQQTIRERLGPTSVDINQSDCLRAVMEEDHLTIDQCDEMAKALREDAARLPCGSDKRDLLRLAESYRALADLKRIVLRRVN
jgi:hypothetical protein